MTEFSGDFQGILKRWDTLERRSETAHAHFSKTVKLYGSRTKLLAMKVQPNISLRTRVFFSVAFENSHEPAAIHAVPYFQNPSSSLVLDFL